VTSPGSLADCVLTFPEHFAAPIGAISVPAESERRSSPVQKAYIAMHKSVKPYFAMQYGICVRPAI
jgi:hypothetical protein